MVYEFVNKIFKKQKFITPETVEIFNAQQSVLMRY